jgi:type IV pilus assembly protein PilV
MGRLKQAGFSLIQVLISVFVLTLGVIGAAGLQLAALRTSQQSAFQTGALQLASEMADRVRANHMQMRRQDAENPFLAVDYRSASDPAPQAPAALCHTVACDSGALAKFDIYEWEKRIKSTLPGGRARICRDSIPWDAAKGTLTWECNPGAGGNASLVIKLGWQGKGRNPDGSLIADAGTTFPPSVAIIVEPYIK